MADTWWKRKTVRVTAALLVAIALFFCGFLAGWYLYRPINSWLYQRHDRKITVRFLHKPAPEIAGTTVTGEPWKLGDQRGKVVLVDFMASWCVPCVGSYPVLKRIRARYGGEGDVVIVGVSLDDEAEALRKHLETYEIPWPVLFEPGAGWQKPVVRRYEVTGIPSIWIIDREGRVEAINAWGEQIEETIERLLHAPPEKAAGEASPATSGARTP